MRQYKLLNQDTVSWNVQKQIWPQFYKHRVHFVLETLKPTNFEDRAFPSQENARDDQTWICQLDSTTAKKLKTPSNAHCTATAR